MLINYLHLALRNLRKNSAYSILNITGVGLSIACCILIFLLVRHHLTFDAYHKNAERTIMVGTEGRGEEVTKGSSVPYPMGAAIRQEYAFLEKTAMVASRQNTLVTLTKEGQAPVKFKEEGIRAFAEPELFEIFDIPLVQGSLESFKEPRVMMISETLAKKYFGQNNAIGQVIKINNQTNFQVVGVLKDIPENTDLRYQMYCSWATIQADSNSRRMLNNWGGIHGGTQCFALLREGYDASALESAFAGFREKYFHPEVRDWYYHAIPMLSTHFDPDYGSGVNKTYIWTLSLIGLFLLLTACVNFINMATAQALNRVREVGVRKAVGSTRAQLFWQFMFETSLIVVIASGIGLLMAWLALPAMKAVTETTLVMDFGRDFMLYGFLALLMVLVAFISGAYPGLALSGFKPAASLKGPVEGRSRGGFTLRRILVGTQFAISQVLIIGAVVVSVQMEYARTANLGFQQEGIVTMPLPGRNEAQRLYTLKQTLSELSGVEQVTLCMQPPASDDNWNTSILLEGRPEREKWDVNIKFMDKQYLETFGLTILAGRNLEASDTIKEYIVNEEVVKKLGFSSPEEILGKQIAVDQTAFPVVGVVKNFHNHSFHEDIQPQAMCSDVQNYDVCAVRMNLKQISTLLPVLEKTWNASFPDYYFEYQFVDEQIAEFYIQEAMIMKMVRFFAGIAVFIGCLGLYGLAAFMVTRKRKEIGIRKTLGASLGGILWLFGKEYTRLILLAFIVAAPLGWWAMNTWLQNYVFHIQIGAGIFVAALLLTLLLAVATVGIQSLKAALTNPVTSLRSE